MKPLDENDRLRAGTLPRDPLADAAPYEPSGRATSLPSTNGRPIRQLPPFRSIEEMAAATDASIAWVWRGVIALTMVTMLVGKPKKGKSTLTYALLAALEEGRRFLGLDTLQTIAVLITEEVTSTVLQKCRRFGLQHTRCWTRSDRVVGASFTDILTAAVDEALRIGAKIVVVDTLAGWAGMGPDVEKDPGHGQALFDQLQAAAQRGVAILVVHHARKAMGEEADVARGSGAFVAAADVQVQISVPSQGDTRTLTFIGRADETPEDINCQLVGTHFEVLSAKDMHDRSKGRVRDALLTRLRREQGQVLSALREAVGARKVTVEEVLKELVASGEAHSSGTGTRGSPKLFWRGPALTEPPTAEGSDSGPASPPSDELPLTGPEGDLGLPVPVPPIRGGTRVRNPDPGPRGIPDPGPGPESDRSPESPPTPRDGAGSRPKRRRGPPPDPSKAGTAGV